MFRPSLVPDAPPTGEPTTVISALTLDTGIGFTEFVEVNVGFLHGSFRDLDIELESPSGAVSKLAVHFDTFTDYYDPFNDFVPLRGAFRFGSARHLGEDPNGVWKLRVTDRIHVVDGAFEGWNLIVYGHAPTPDAPTVDARPVFNEGATTTRSVAENTPGGGNVGDPVAANDDDGLTYTLAGPDAALFEVAADSGQIRVGAATTLDFEDAGNPDHEYQVTVTATDPSGASASVTVTIAVTDLSLGEAGDTYDIDHNEVIDRDEALAAVKDYFDDLITTDEVIAVVLLYFDG